MSIYGDQGSPTDVPEVGSPSLGFLGHIPDISIGPVEFGVTFLESVFGNLNYMIWLSFVLLILSYDRPLPDLARPPHPRRRRASARGRHRRDLGLRDPLRRRDHVGRARGARRCVPFGGQRGSLRPEPDRRTRLHRDRRADLRNWRPFGAYAACLLFGFSSALGDRLPAYFQEGSATPLLFNALPYVLTLIAVAGIIGRSIPPAAIGRPYRKQ